MRTRFNPASVRKGFLRLCAIGLCLNLMLMVIPARFKPYLVRRYWTDYGTLVELVTKERGLGPWGMVVGHHAKLYQDQDRSHLDPMRQEWAIAKDLPPPPSTIDTRRLMWDGWGPSCTNTPDGTGIAEVGEYVCVPYSAFAIGLAIPLVWSGIKRRRMNESNDER